MDYTFINTFEDAYSYFCKVGNKSFSAKCRGKDLREQLYKIIGKEFVETYDSMTHMFWDYKNPGQQKFCKECGKKTKFKNHVGYDQYCGSECSRKAGFKGPKEGEKYDMMISKRKQSMKNLLDDPIRGKEYRNKISITSAERMSSSEARKEKSDMMKSMIALGKFTPNITNSWTHWDIVVDGIKFRSSFEGVFYLASIHILNINLKYEKLRIPYNDGQKIRNYIVDFIDIENHVCYEVKPKSLLNDEINIRKKNALIDWCDKNNYTYVEITEMELSNFFKRMQDLQHPFLKEVKQRYPEWI